MATTAMVIADRGGTRTGDGRYVSRHDDGPDKDYRSPRRAQGAEQHHIEIGARVVTVVTVVTTSAGTPRGAALHLLDVPVRTRARNRPLRRLHLRTRKAQSILPRRACSPQ
jgi:hypothetical protein